MLKNLGNGLQVVLTELDELLPHEEVIETRVNSRLEKIVEVGFYKPILVDDVTGVILDGHHKNAAAKKLSLDLVPVILVDYMADDRISVDVWPDCGKSSITKKEVTDMAFSGKLFPPKTSHHILSFALPKLNVSIDELCRPACSA